jgi:hypothetical protein
LLADGSDGEAQKFADSTDPDPGTLSFIPHPTPTTAFGVIRKPGKHIERYDDCDDYYFWYLKPEVVV